jgi:enolase-phosphatase E1
MMNFSGRGILLDIEGTISSLSYVREVLFPYARQRLGVAVRNLWNDEAMPRIREELAHLHKSPDFNTWTGGPGMPPERRLKMMTDALHTLMDQDAKVGPLKEIQGLIWRDGFGEGTLRSHLYPEVPRVLREWKHRGLDLRIYSSGSIEAQRQFFMHVDTGTDTVSNLLPLFNGHYDTAIGSKKDAGSYQKIIKAVQLPASSILFLSDIAAELDAARAAGLQTGILCRPENPPLPDSVVHPRLHTLDDVHIV